MHLSSTGNFLYKRKTPYWFPSSPFHYPNDSIVEEKIKQILYIFYKTLEDVQIF